MTRYMRELRSEIASIISKREGKLTTLDQYWIIDTEMENAIAFIWPSESKYNPRWLSRKLDQRKWIEVKKHSIIPSAGKDKKIKFYQLVVRKIETSV